MIAYILCFILGFVIGIACCKDVEKEVLNEIQADKNRTPLTDDARMRLRDKVRK